jgi:HEAT repeat protein
MWDILRRVQGEDHTTNSDVPGCVGLEANLNHIAMFECKDNPKPFDATQLTEPYGVRVYSKLVRNLKSDDLVLRRKAVAAMLHYFDQKQEHVISTIMYGGIPTLVAHLQDPDAEVRVNCCKALQRIVVTPKGQREFLDARFVQQLKEAVGDPEDEVQVHALRVMGGLDAYWNDREGTKALIDADCIPLFLSKLDSSPEVQAEALRSLLKVFNVEIAYQVVLSNGGMQQVAALLDSPHTPVLEQAADTIASLCMYNEGKAASATDRTTMQNLVTLIQHEDTGVRKAALGAVMAITIDITGKEQALQCGVVEALMQIVHNETDYDALKNTLKCVCNVAETPVGRKQLTAMLPRLQHLAASLPAESRVPMAAITAIEVVTRRP